jgi:hypothetical protein
MRARPAPRVATLAAAAALAVAFATSGCHLLNPEGCTEEAATLQPLEPEMLHTTYLAWPATGLTTTAVNIVSGPYDGYYTCQGRGYALAPILKVYEALSDPNATIVHNQDGQPHLDIPTWYGIDPLSVSSVSFRVFYLTDTHNSVVPTVKFDIISRMGWLQGSYADPIELGFRSHKTCGTTHIQLMDGSLTARPVPPTDLPAGVADATAIEMIFHLKADTQTQDDCNGTLQNHWDDMVTVLTSLMSGP